jgi:hypothetical protein
VLERIIFFWYYGMKTHKKSTEFSEKLISSFFSNTTLSVRARLQVLGLVFLPRRHWFDLSSFQVRFMKNYTSMREELFREFLFSFLIIIPPVLYTHSYHTDSLQSQESTAFSNSAIKRYYLQEVRNISSSEILQSLTPQYGAQLLITINVSLLLLHIKHSKFLLHIISTSLLKT